MFAILGPLVVMLTRGNESPYVRHHSVEALNFHITFTLAMIVSAVLVIVVVGILLMVVVGVTGLVLAILAAVAASRGEWYRYPISLRLVR